MTNRELLRKADIALSDLAAGGILPPAQGDRFIRQLIDSPTILNEARVVTMNGPDMKINRIGFGTRIMRPARQAGGFNDDGTNDRHLLEAERAKPDFAQLALHTEELMAEVHIPYEVLEDNIEGGNVRARNGDSAGGLMDTLIALMGDRAALDLEEVGLLGDTASGDAYLAMFDGYLKLANQHTVDASGATIDKNLVKAGIKAMPDKYLRNRGALRNYVSVDNETEFRDTYANRGTALGDAMLQGNSPVYAFGTQVVGVPMMPANRGLLTDPRNLIFAIQRRIMMEYEKDIRARVFIIVLTCRVDFAIEEPDAVVSYTAIG